MKPAPVTAQPSTEADVQARVTTYLLAARLFREPPSEELVRDMAPSWSQGAEAIALEYTRLFAVPGEQSVQPYESVYCDTLTIDSSTACSPYFVSEPPPDGLRGFLHGPSAIAVREAYQQAGFELRPAIHELSDHLAIEIEFLGRLLERGADEQARAFFTNHLGRWVFRCLEEIKGKTRLGCYRSLAEDLTAFLQREQEALIANV